jgi:DNA-directed RNA polymerase specialized sigma24 family protein
MRETHKLAAWVHVVTVNTVHDELRRQVRRFFLLDRSGVELLGDTKWRCAICSRAPKSVIE